MTKKFITLSLAFAILCSCITSCKRAQKHIQPFYKIEENGLYGFIDTLGNKVIDTKYLAVSSFGKNGLAVAVVDTIYKDEYGKAFTNNKNIKSRFFYIKYGYINQEDKFTINPNLIRKILVKKNTLFDGKYLSDYIEEQSTFEFEDGLAAYQDTTKNLYGFIDTLGNVKIEPQYNSVRCFSEGRAPVCKYIKKVLPVSSHLLWGFIDKENKLVADFKYAKLSWVNKGRAFGYMWSESRDTFSLNSSYILNADGTITKGISDSTVTEGKCYEEVAVLLDANGHIIRNDLSNNYFYNGFPDNSNLCLGELRYDAPQGFLLSNKYIFVKKDGSILKPFDGMNDIEQSEEFQKGIYLGYLSMQDPELIINCCSGMYDGYACFTLDSKRKEWLFVNDKLLVLKPINGWDFYDDVLPFNCGLAAIKHNGKWGYVDKNFKIVIPLKYDSCEIAMKSLLKVYQKKINTNILIESYITRKDSIVWQKIIEGKESVCNIYSNKKKLEYGQWQYKNKNENVPIICIFGISLFLIVSATLYKRYNRKN